MVVVKDHGTEISQHLSNQSIDAPQFRLQKVAGTWTCCSKSQLGYLFINQSIDADSHNLDCSRWPVHGLVISSFN